MNKTFGMDEFSTRIASGKVKIVRIGLLPLLIVSVSDAARTARNVRRRNFEHSSRIMDSFHPRVPTSCRQSLGYVQLQPGERFQGTDMDAGSKLKVQGGRVRIL
jgi:hypothetical protein